MCPWQKGHNCYCSDMSTNKKKSAAVKSIKKVPSKKNKIVVKAAVKKKTPKKTASSPTQDKMTKEALKLVDRASALLRKGIKTGSKTTHEARAALHQEAHSLLGKATSNLDEALKAGTSFLQNAIKKI